MTEDRLFHIVEDGFAIVRCKGVWRQAKIYHRQGRLFIGYGSGFLKLYKHGTSRTDIFVDDIILPVPMATGTCGEITIEVGDG